MAWDFSTDPEWAQQLEWVEDFVRAESNRSTIVNESHDLNDPVRKELIPPLQENVKSAACGPATSARSSAAPATGRSSWRCSTRSSAARGRADRVRLPGPRLRQQRDPRPLRHARAEGALPRAAARQRDRLLLLDDRAAGRRRPEGVHHHRRARRRRVGHQRREVVLLARVDGVVPDRDGRHRAGQPAVPAHSMFVVPADTPGIEIIRNVGLGYQPPEAAAATPTSATTTCACPPSTCSASAAGRSSSPRPASAAGASTTRCAPSAWSGACST